LMFQKQLQAVVVTCGLMGLDRDLYSLLI